MIGFVLGVEFIGTKYRLWCGNGYQMLFAVGEIVFAAVAFKVRDWRNLELVVAAMIGSLFFLSL
jgi:multidrug transporter EmrE-like cation transporter